MLVMQTTCVSVYLYTLTHYFYTLYIMQYITSNCVSCVQDADLYGHGGHSPAFVPTFGSVLPTKMVRHLHTRQQHSTTPADAHRQFQLQCILAATIWFLLEG